MNGLIIIDKPAGWTSHDVIAKLRGILKEKRIGHSGTLDPMATGVLPIFIGRATRAVEFSQSDDKEYVAGLRLGIVTDTQDITGRVLSTSERTACVADLKQALRHFTGEQQQLPPMYSAVKIGGKKLYQLARRGINVERQPRSVTFHALDLLEQNNDDYLLRVHCSKGTYIRTLCNDIGSFLGCGGTMYSLRRTRAGRFTIEESITLSDVESAASAGRADSLLKPVDTLFDHYPAVALDENQIKRCLNGNAFPTDQDDGLYRVYDRNNNFLMLGRAENGIMHTVKSFFNV